MLTNKYISLYKQWRLQSIKNGDSNENICLYEMISGVNELIPFCQNSHYYH